MNRIIESRTTRGRHIPGAGVLSRGAGLRHFVTPNIFISFGKMCMQEFALEPMLGGASRVSAIIGGESVLEPIVGGRKSLKVVLAADGGVVTC